MGRPSKVQPGKFELDAHAHKKLVQHLLDRTRAWTPDTLKLGKSWYPTGQEDSAHLGAQMGGGAAHGAAVFAKLSPQTDWQLNRMMGLQTLQLGEKATSKIHEAALLTGKENTDARVQLRREAGLPGTPLNHSTTGDISSVLHMRDTATSTSDPFTKNNFSKLGTNYSTKVHDFGQSLATGGSYPKPPVDVHAYDAAVNTLTSATDVAHSHLNKAHVYNFVQSAYVKAHAHAAKHGVIPSDMTLGDYQAVHWIHQQTQKAAVNPKSMGAVRANATAVEGYRTRMPELDPAKQGLSPITRLDHFLAGQGGV
jgi:hypothetical protein